MAMANLCKLERGSNQFKPVVIESGKGEVPQIYGTTASVAAEKAGVSAKTMEHATKVDRHGAPELVEAVKAG